MNDTLVVYALDSREWLSVLAATHPLLFELVRREALDALLRTAPVERQAALREIQDRIDQNLAEALGVDTCSRMQISDTEVSAQWEHLDPAFAEFLRRKMAELFIWSAPAEIQERLRAQQWRIDQICARAKHPLGAAVRLNGMLMESLDELNDALHVFVHGSTALPVETHECRTAKVLSFKRKDDP